MNETLDVQSIRKAFEEAGQGQVFRFWDELDAESREQLLAQAANIDLGELSTLVAEHITGSSECGIELAGLEPAPYIALPDKGGMRLFGNLLGRRERRLFVRVVWLHFVWLADREHASATTGQRALIR